MSEIKVSVIMSTLNGGESIIRSIDSILNQTFQSYELIVCNDGSDDIITDKVLAKYELHEKVVIIKNIENYGLAYSLNKCINYTKGEYLLRMDDDDYSEPNRIGRLVHELENNSGASFIGSFAKVIGENYEKVLRLPIYPNRKDVFNSKAFVHASILIKKEIIQSVGNYTVSKETNRLEDYDLFNKLYNNGFVGKNISDCLYVIDERNNWNSKRDLMFRIREFKLRYHWFKKQNLPLNYIPFLLKPIIIGLLPIRIYKFLRAKTL